MEKFQNYITLCGTCINELVVCALLYIGNLSTYIYSLHYSKTAHVDSFDIDPSWMIPMFIMSKSIGCFMVDVFKRRLSFRFTYGIGIVLFGGSICLTYVTVSHSIWATTLSFMVVGGIGNAIINTGHMVYIAMWFDSRVGLASALPLCVSTLGGIVMNLAISSYVNPDNLDPDVIHGKLRLFSQPEILDRVPTIFLLLGAVTAGVQVIGFFLLKEPPYKSVPPPCDTRLLEDEKQRCTDERTSSPDNNNHRSYTSEIGVHPNEPHDDPSPISSREEELSPTTNTSGRRKPNVADSNPQTSTSVEVSIKEDIDTTPFMTPLQVLKSQTFYVLECTIIALNFGLIIGTNYYKLFGQLSIDDDQFLAFIGSCSSISVIPFFLGLGTLVDRCGIKNTLVAYLAASSFSLSLWYFTVGISRWLFLVWTLLVQSVHISEFMIICLSSLKIFGRRYYATNIGVISLAAILVNVLSPFLISAIISNFGWFLLFFTGGCVSFVALIIIILGMPFI